MTRKPLPLALAATAAPLLAACSEARSDDEAFGQRVRAYLLEHPEVLEEAITRLDQKRAEASAAQQSKALVANRSALERDPRDPAFGPANAPITVVEFFDYRCGFCKSAAPEVINLLASEKDVRFVFKELPILPDASGQVGVSERAARLALAAHRKGAYVAVHRDLMAARALDDAALARIAGQHGLDAAVLKASPEANVQDHLNDTRELAESLGVQGTPAFYVGDTVVPGADIEALRAAIQKARGGGKAAA